MSKKTKVSLVQINPAFMGGLFFPYSVGLLQAYAQKCLSNIEAFEIDIPIFYKQPLQQSIQKLYQADIVGFSAYIWNFERSLAIAKQLKAINPSCLIVFGGPHVPDQAKEFMLEHPFIDICCHGEGESTFLKILENYADKNWQGINGISYRHSTGDILSQPKQPRIKDTKTIPSPYLTGIFNSIMSENPDTRWVAVWETNRGCPFSCTFCDWGSATRSKVLGFDLEQVFKEFEWFANHQIETVFVGDANFGILKRDLQIAKFAVQTKKRYNYPDYLYIQNTKNVTERAYEVQKLLYDSGLSKEVALSLQSLSPEALNDTKRKNISLDSYHELQRRFIKQNIVTYTDMIVGLPGETYDSFSAGVSSIIEKGQYHQIRFYNALILPNAEMGQKKYLSQYQIETVKIPFEDKQDQSDNIKEFSEIIIANYSTSKSDWRKIRTFAYMTSFLYFGQKLLQVPLTLIQQNTAISYRELIEIFLKVNSSQYPLLSSIRDFFAEKSLHVQQGKPELCWGPGNDKLAQSKMVPDLYMQAKLYTDQQLELFYSETLILLQQELTIPPAILKELLNYSQDIFNIYFSRKYVLADDIAKLQHKTYQYSFDVQQAFLLALNNQSYPLMMQKTPSTYSYQSILSTLPGMI